MIRSQLPNKLLWNTLYGKIQKVKMDDNQMEYIRFVNDEIKAYAYAPYPRIFSANPHSVSTL